MQPAVSVAAQKVTFSSFACLLRLLEISSASDQNLSEVVSVLSELMQRSHAIWHGFFCRTYAIWHEFFPEIVPIGMGSG